MAYDESLAHRIRDYLGPRADVTEKKMFGGLAFLINGNMAIAASGQGGLLVRIDPAKTPEVLASTDAQMMVMRGREMPGWLRASAEGLTDERLAFWIDLAAAFTESLAAKAGQGRSADSTLPSKNLS